MINDFLQYFTYCPIAALDRKFRFRTGIYRKFWSYRILVDNDGLISKHFSELRCVQYLLRKSDFSKPEIGRNTISGPEKYYFLS